ncbi:ubiquitin-specific protease ubp2 [Apophysomyces sp. BC1021]|nr:ubiquitin-specific protease ubp2 [Apophysomyces sp. BC1021]
MLSTLKIYVSDLLKDVRKNINTSNPRFLARVGMNDTSKALLETIGFTLKDNCFIAPTDDSPAIERSRLTRILEELQLSLYSFNLELQQYGQAPAMIDNAPSLAEQPIRSLLGASYEFERSMANSNLSRAYATLGLTSGASPRLTIWVYHRLFEEDPFGSFIYMDALAEIANGTNDEFLLTEVAMERSKGQLGSQDVEQAYRHFGITSDEHADEKLLMAVYQVKTGDEPKDMTLHREKLRIIAASRQSSVLHDFLREEEVAKQPRIDTVIRMDEYVEDEESDGWQSKKIGAIKVDEAETRHSSHFLVVALLRDLFINLTYSTEKAISPVYDLAYMALLNGKEDEAITAESSTTHNQKEEHVIVYTDEPKKEPSISTESTMTPSETHETVSERASNSDPEAMPDQESGPMESENVSVEEEKEQSTLNELKKDNDALPSYEEALDTAGPSITVEKKGPAQDIKKELNAANMMFGKQQDVTECMGNVMYLVEAALKPLETHDGEQVRDMVRDTFYGKARQILTYKDTETALSVKKVKEEEFSHLIVDAGEGKDLYDGLDEYFFADRVENFRGGHEAVREVTVSTFPPVLQIIVQRVQFDRATVNVYKSNSFVQFDKIIYLDRYCGNNFEALADRRAQVTAWRKEIESNNRSIEQLTNNKAYPMPVPDMLEATAHILAEYRKEQNKDVHIYEKALEVLQKEADTAKNLIEQSTQTVQDLRSRIRSQYKDLTKLAYRIHAVFIHQGQANYGHYWVYIYDKPKDQWWKYNDSQVSKVDESEIFRDTTGSTANPYFLVYVKDEVSEALVETAVERELASRIPPASVQ